jgi:SAM-dependent methyltransferase
MSAALAGALVGRAARAATGTTDMMAVPGDRSAADSVNAGQVGDAAAPGGVASADSVHTRADGDARSSARSVADGAAAMDGLPAGGSLVLVDVVPELLAAAEEAAARAVGVCGAVNVRTFRADMADSGSFAGLPAADLVWASNVVHHLPDQRAAVGTLAGLLAPGGCLALSEGGLSMRCLPWDLGVGEPGLQDRLIAAHGTWFHRMRAEMTGVVRMPVGWNQAMSEAGLSGVTAFSYLVDVPAPLSAAGRDAVVSWLTWMTHGAADLLGPDDVAALDRLLDPADQANVARRDDVFMLKASTVHLGWR